jgi:hypothetical protein
MADLAIPIGEARVNVGWAGQNGDLEDPVSVDATDDEVKRWVAEAIATGTVPGIPADPSVHQRIQDFVVDRFPPNDVRAYSIIMVRPKANFG